jgi:hypothetical protein
LNVKQFENLRTICSHESTNRGYFYIKKSPSSVELGLVDRPGLEPGLF